LVVGLAGLILLCGAPSYADVDQDAAAQVVTPVETKGEWANYPKAHLKGVRFMAEPHVVNRTPKSELWLAEFADPDGNQLALMSEVAV